MKSQLEVEAVTTLKPNNLHFKNIHTFHVKFCFKLCAVTAHSQEPARGT